MAPVVIAVTGASGKLGSATIGYLLERGVSPANIIALVRDPAKAGAHAARGIQVRRGDYTDPASLQRALSGVDRLAFVSTSALGEERMLHHGNVVRAARAAKVGHIFYTSVIKPAAVAKFAASPGHYQTEVLIRDSGLPWTFLRNNLYLDLVPLMFGDALASGKLVHNGGDGRIGFVARQDIACGFAAALTAEGNANRAFAITAQSPYSLGDVARALGRAGGKSVTYEAMNSQQLRDAMTAKGVPPPIVEMSVALGEAVRAGEFDAGSNDLATLMGRTPMNLEQFLTLALARKEG
jgi:NAD(P)H dehydrogenase (quinone)